MNMYAAKIHHLFICLAWYFTGTVLVYGSNK